MAQAFGRACCEQGLKAYFIKMTELRDRMTDARRTGREGALLASLVRPSCLIIDEVGHCEEGIRASIVRERPRESLRL